MDNRDNPDPGGEFGSDSSWTTSLGPDSDTVNYFFASDRESSILSEFGWNLQTSSQVERFGDLDQIEHEDKSDLAGNFGFTPESSSGLQGSVSGSGGGDPARVGRSRGGGGGGDISTSNPSVSSSSSEDPADKSTSSGGKPPEIP